MWQSVNRSYLLSFFPSNIVAASRLLTRAAVVVEVAEVAAAVVVVRLLEGTGGLWSV